MHEMSWNAPAGPLWTGNFRLGGTLYYKNINDCLSWPTWTSGRISTETYGFAAQENSPLAHEPDFDFLNGFSGRFSTQNGLLSEA
jgi:hypothetical protein